jgi:hypothetical protein
MEFCLWGAILKLKVFCFGAIPDIMIELIVYGVCHKAGNHDSGIYRNQIIRGPLVIGKKNV